MIPLRTDTPVRGTPLANYVIVAVNLLVFLALDVLGANSESAIKDDLTLDAGMPEWWQFFTYQFLHGDIWHLAGNMLFLWVFGNSVNSKFGNLPYALFYLSAGIFAGWGFAINSDSALIGASGSIAAITTTFMVLFPRSKILFLFFFILITVFELPSLWVILFKVVLWDNILAPRFIGGGADVAYGVHLIGYAYGFAATLCLQLCGALARDQFDLLAIMRRWNQRRAFSSALSDPQAKAQAKYGTVARPIVLDAGKRRELEARLDRITEIRAKIHDALASPASSAAAVDYYEQLTQLNPDQCLPRQQQLAIARLLYARKKYPQAAGAFEMFLKQYPKDREIDDTRLLVGIIYARDLEQYEAAEGHLKLALDSLIDEDRRQQCRQWLDRVGTLLRPASPNTGQ
jgi:membrane associated rhomboid family serine protease